MLRKFDIDINNLIFGIYIIILIIIITEKIYLQNLLPLILIFGFWGIKKYKLIARIYKIFLCFYIFLIIQIFGLLNNFEYYSIKNILTTCVAIIWIYFFLNWKKVKNKKFMILFIFNLFLYIMIIFQKIDFQSRNTMGGYLLFYYLNVAILIYLNTKIRKNFFMIVIGTLFPIVISEFLRARTACISGIAFILLCFIFKKFNRLVRKKTFFILLGSIVIFLIVYMNIKNYTWYTDLNKYSLLYFNKNIDSSRGYLWKASLAELNTVFDLLFGLGTGVTPKLSRYLGSSFHNSFIQVLMQNGVIGLICVILIFYNIWKNIIKIENKELKAIFASIYVIIVLYNCMETCLLQNKFLIGLLQWSLLAFSLVCSKKRVYKNKIK